VEAAEGGGGLETRRLDKRLTTPLYTVYCRQAEDIVDALENITRLASDFAPIKNVLGAAEQASSLRSSASKVPHIHEAKKNPARGRILPNARGAFKQSGRFKVASCCLATLGDDVVADALAFV